LSREDALARAAKEYGVQEEDLRRTLNTSPRFWEQTPGKRFAYVKCLTAVLLDQAEEGSLIYHGNVGHLLLAEVSHALRVRVVADLEYRIRAAMDQAGFTRDKAIAHIRQVDEERGRWARLLYGVEWQDPTQYHLILNLAQVSVSSACEVIVRMVEMDEFQPTEESRRQFANLRLGARVWAALARNPVTRSAALQVTARDGDVVITGNAGSSKALELIPQIASEVEGVDRVHSEAGLGADWYW
jgi:osmotically-inducible protein OsmY